MRARLAAVLLFAACGGPPSGGHADAPGPGSDGTTAGSDAASFLATLDGDRDRLLATYLAYLEANPTQTQSNGLSGTTIHTVCALWAALAPSPQEVFLTITHRLYGSVMHGGDHVL